METHEETNWQQLTANLRAAADSLRVISSDFRANKADDRAVGGRHGSQHLKTWSYDGDLSRVRTLSPISIPCAFCTINELSVQEYRLGHRCTHNARGTLTARVSRVDEVFRTTTVLFEYRHNDPTRESIAVQIPCAFEVIRDTPNVVTEQAVRMLSELNAGLGDLEHARKVAIFDRTDRSGLIA